MLETRGRGVGSELPRQLVSEVTRVKFAGFGSNTAAWTHLHDESPSGPKQFVSYQMAALSFLGHLPSSIGIGIGRLFGSSVLLMLLMARCMNLLFYVGIVATALRAVPVARWPLTLAALFPNVFFVAAVVSPDALAVALVISTIALALLIRDRLRNGVAIPRSVWVAAYATALALGNAKAPYFFVVAVFGLACWWIHGRTRWLIVGVCIAAIGMGAFWSLVFSDRYVLGADTAITSIHPSPLEEVAHAAAGRFNPEGQWRKLRDNPPAFGGAVWRMVSKQGHRLLGETLIDYALWTPAPWLEFIGIAWLLLLRYAPQEGDSAQFRRSERGLLWFLLAGSTLAVLMSLWLFDTPYLQRDAQVMGMQGRYLIPLIPLLVIAMASQQRPRIPLPKLIGIQIVFAGLVGFAALRGHVPKATIDLLRTLVVRR